MFYLKGLKKHRDGWNVRYTPSAYKQGYAALGEAQKMAQDMLEEHPVVDHITISRQKDGSWPFVETVYRNKSAVLSANNVPPPHSILIQDLEEEF